MSNFPGEFRKTLNGVSALLDDFTSWFSGANHKDDLSLSVKSDVSVYQKLVTFHLQDTFLEDILDTAGVSPSPGTPLPPCVRPSVSRGSA